MLPLYCTTGTWKGCYATNVSWEGGKLNLPLEPTFTKFLTPINTFFFSTLYTSTVQTCLIRKSTKVDRYYWWVLRNHFFDLLTCRQVTHLFNNNMQVIPLFGFLTNLFSKSFNYFRNVCHLFVGSKYQLIIKQVDALISFFLSLLKKTNNHFCYFHAFCEQIS